MEPRDRDRGPQAADAEGREKKDGSASHWLVEVTAAGRAASGLSWPWRCTVGFGVKVKRLGEQRETAAPEKTWFVGALELSRTVECKGFAGSSTDNDGLQTPRPLWTVDGVRAGGQRCQVAQGGEGLAFLSSSRSRPFPGRVQVGKYRSSQLNLLLARPLAAPPPNESEAF